MCTKFVGRAQSNLFYLLIEKIKIELGSLSLYIACVNNYMMYMIYVDCKYVINKSLIFLAQKNVNYRKLLSTSTILME